MTRFAFVRPLALLPFLALFLETRPAFAAPAAVFVEGGTVKVRPGSPVKPLVTAKIQAARNEFEPFQVVINGGDSGVTGLRASASSLAGPSGATVPSSALALYRVDNLEITTPSGSIGATGTWPDPLVPAVDDTDGEIRSAFPFNVAPGISRAIWVDVLVPRDAPAGTYHGSISLNGANGFSAEVPVELEVWDFELPSTSTLASAFLAWAPNICLAHTGAQDCGGPSRAAELMAKYERLALDHRITLPNIWVLRNNGSDWTAFDQAFGPLLDGTAQTKLSGARMTSAQYTWEQTVDGYRAFAAHFRSKGWSDRLYDYTADEPPGGTPWSDIPPRAEKAKAGDAAYRILVTTSLASATNAGVASLIDLLVPAINSMEPIGKADQRPKYDEWIASGKGVWLYQSCMSHGCAYGEGPPPGSAWPSYMVDVSAMHNRLMQWADFNSRVSGELYYETALAFSRDPWKSVFFYSGNGDGTFFYPGTPSHIGGTSQVPVASLRLKMVREGMEDYEYLALVSKRGDQELARQIVREVLPTASSVTDDPSRIVSARQRLARRILELSAEKSDGGCGSADSGASSDPADAGSSESPDSGTSSDPADAGNESPDSGTSSDPTDAGNESPDSGASSNPADAGPCDAGGEGSSAGAHCASAGGRLPLALVAELGIAGALWVRRKRKRARRA
jgi:hypothetical protein